MVTDKVRLTQAFAFPSPCTNASLYRRSELKVNLLSIKITFMAGNSAAHGWGMATTGRAASIIVCAGAILMSYRELIVLLPCHSLEDFPTHHEGDDAHSLLASWTALWHPALLAAAGQAPSWRRVDDPPNEVKDRLIVVPSVCVQRLPSGFAQRVKDEGGVLIRKTDNREEIVAAALDGLGSSPEARGLSSELAVDFLALGYCYLQIELLTRQMRYASNLDETYFKTTAVAAAVAAIEGNEELAREKLSACFSVLAEERDHYYPVDAFVLDLNLTAPTTFGESLRAEFARISPTNVLITADAVAEIAEKQPATFVALKEGLTAGRVGLVGGEASESQLPLLSHESILSALQKGLAKYETLLGQQPKIFGRWRYGLTPHLPGILHRLGFQGALHTDFDEGKTPAGVQFKIRWEGLDGSAIDAIAKSPLDASKPQTFLSLATKLGESMDSDHVATICLAHWPGQASPWIEDLRRVAKYCSALGKWVTIDEYFAKTDQPGQLDRFEAARYKSPYLKQAVIRKHDDPVSSQVRYWDAEARQTAVEAMESLAVLVTGRVQGPQAQEQDAAAREVATALTSSSTGARGCLVINPCSFVRRVGLEGMRLNGLPTIERPVYAADETSGQQHAVVDVPAFGFVHLTQGKPAPRDKKAILLAEEGVLRNEFFEAILNPTTGSLAAIHEYKSRGNRLSQQLALRMPGGKQKPGDSYRDPDESAVYSVMAADSMETTISTTTLGEIVTRGRLLDVNGNRLAGFVQKYRLWRGSRVLHVEIEIDPAEEPRADPWNSYYCCRFAWPDELAELNRTVNETRQPVSEKRFESPHYVEINDGKNTTTILTGGLTFHRRHEQRMLDTLLITRGERERKFRFGIGVDVAYPMHEAIGLLTPPIVVPDCPQPSSGASGWLLHLSSRNVIATSIAPLADGEKVVGFRARLLETAGRPANLALSAFREIKSASTTDFQGASIAELKIEDGKAKLDMAAHEWVEVHARW
jgi:alpha-mannosidase